MSKNLEKYENRYMIYIYIYLFLYIIFIIKSNIYFYNEIINHNCEKTASYILINFLSHAYHNNRERQC